MTFYQKIHGLILLLTLGLTALIIFVCFDAPYSNKFIVETAAIFLSELMYGVSIIVVSARHDRIMFLSAGYPLAAFRYFIFSLLMAFAVNSSLETRYFVVIHTAGLVITIILMLFYLMADRNFCDQETADGLKKRIAFDFQNMITEIKITAEAVFADDPALLKPLESLADDFRYAADSSEKTLEKDREIMLVFNDLRSTMKTRDRDAFRNSVENLRLALQIREQMK